MNDRDQAILWAREVVAHPEKYLILDTETTGLNWGCEIIQIAIIDGNYNQVINTLVKPLASIPAQSTAIHGITNAMVQDARPWKEVWPEVVNVISGQHVIIYNAGFDLKMIKSSCSLSHTHTPPFPLDAHCAMLEYAAYYGDWDDYHGNYRWQKLQGGDHSALGDVNATMDLIYTMASSQLSEDK